MNRATVPELVRAVSLVGRIVGAGQAVYCFEGRFALPLGAGWSLVLSPDDAGRFRLDAVLRGHVRATMWALVGDDARLSELAYQAETEAAALAARKG